MNLITIIMQIAGTIILLTLAISSLFVSWGYLVEKRTQAQWEYNRIVERDTLRNFGSELKSVSYWFSEDLSVVTALEAIGDYLMRSGTFEVSQIRDNWKKHNV